MEDATDFMVPTPREIVDTSLPRIQSQTTLKRTASDSFPETLETSGSRKRMKEDEDHKQQQQLEGAEGSVVAENAALADQLAQELQCGCCSELVYRPVLVAPCQHFFCGSCCVLWIRNGGTNCPACRGISTSVTPFRALQTVLDVLLRAAPHKARSERERQQADEIYTGTSMRLPAPREVSPEPDINPSDFVRPCPTCLAGNPYGWRCPQPIVDPNVDPEHAWRLEDGPTPPGHALCGNCENLLALASPLTSKCDFCQVSFCGIGVQGRCIAAPVLSQQPHGLSDVGDLIQSSAVYESFNSNTVEVEIMLDYLTAQRINPRHIYREIVTHIQAQPRKFAPLIESELFVDVYSLPAGTDPDPEAPRNKICRHCAAEVFLYGLREWFLRERQKGFLEENIMNKKDCVDGAECNRQGELDHSREFNHMVPYARQLDDRPLPAQDVAHSPPTDNDDIPVLFHENLATEVPVINDTSSDQGHPWLSDASAQDSDF